MREIFKRVIHACGQVWLQASKSYVSFNRLGAFVSMRPMVLLVAAFFAIMPSVTFALSIPSSTTEGSPTDPYGGYTIFMATPTFIGVSSASTSTKAVMSEALYNNQSSRPFALHLPNSSSNYTGALLTLGSGVQISSSDASCAGSTISVNPSGSLKIELSNGGSCNLQVTFPSGSGAYAGATIAATLGRDAVGYYTLTSGTYTAPPAVAPGAPTAVSATAGDRSAIVSFTAPSSNGGATITNYTVTSSPGGITGTGSSSPITVTGLTNGTPYTFTVTATNSAGTGVASTASSAVTPLPLSMSPASGALTAATVGVQYSAMITVSGGTPSYVWALSNNHSLPAGLSIQPIDATTAEIYGIPTQAGTDSFTLNVYDANSGTTSQAYTLTVNPGITLTLSPAAGSLTAASVGSAYNLTFSTSGGTGPYVYSVTHGTLPSGLTLNSSSGALSGTPTMQETATFTVEVTDTGNSVTQSENYSIVVGAVQSTPATAFDAAEDTILDTVTNDATLSILSTLSFNQNMLRDARSRFISRPTNESKGDEALNVDGTLNADTITLSSMGTFFGKTGLQNGTQRLVFGDFNIQRDSASGASTATLNGRVAWEQTVSDTTMMGYFIGGELAHSNIAGDFEGDQNRLGLSVGGYMVQEVGDQIYLDGFVTFEAGRNNMSMASDVLALDSDYATRSATLGAALSGVIAQKGYEIWPELSISYGRTWIGDVTFTGSAYSLVDNTLSLDADQVSLGKVMLRPEFRVPLDGLSGASSLQLVTFAPRLLCEQITTVATEENCGGGVEVAFVGRTADGLSNVTAKIVADRAADSTTSSVQLNLEHRF